jgi:F0F1-type ATP synthase membrane subunit b/b'
MTQPGSSAVEQARVAWRRALEDTQTGLAAAREQAEHELRRRWSLLRDAVEQALAAGMSRDDVARRLGLTPGVIDSLLKRDGSPLPA